MKLQILGAMALALLLAGCGATSQPRLIETRYIMVMPPISMFQCPQVKSFPKAATLTDVQVARILVQLYKNNKMCKANIDAIQKYLDDAQKVVEAPKPK